MKRNYLLVSNKPWHVNLFLELKSRKKENWVLIKKKKDFNIKFLKKFNPKKVFITHWSFKIEKNIWNNFECIVFHMTDLPYGRGGSPLQNLIIRGHNDTMISAIKCVKDLDAGPIYLKKPLSLEGNAKDIYIRASHIIEDMIVEILDTSPKPEKQKGKVVKFMRRKPEDGDLRMAESLDEVYNYIRMLDADGYPPAFVRIGDYKLEFSRASKKVDAVEAHVKIIRGNENE